MRGHTLPPPDQLKRLNYWTCAYFDSMWVFEILMGCAAVDILDRLGHPSNSNYGVAMLPGKSLRLYTSYATLPAEYSQFRQREAPREIKA